MVQTSYEGSLDTRSDNRDGGKWVGLRSILAVEPIVPMIDWMRRGGERGVKDSGFSRAVWP